jgi:hypothetical protein
MHDDLLKNLIQEADARLRSPAREPAEFAARVRTVCQRRRCRRWGVAAAALVLAACLLWRAAPWGHVPQGGQPAPEVAVATKVEPQPPKRTLPATTTHRTGPDEQVRREERFVRRLLLAQRARRLADEAEEIGGRMTMPASRDEQVGPAAAGCLVSGDRKRAAGLSVASAQEDYGRVIELFPDTVWADQAKARLASLKP